MINVIHYILIPFKIILFVILIILGIYILKHTNGDGNTTTLIIIFYKFVVHYLMSYNIDISDEDYNKYMRYLYSDEKFLCVFNHLSTIDGFVLNKHKFYDYISYDDKTNKKTGSIFVNMNEKTNVASKIKDRIYNRKSGENILFISPSEANLPTEIENIGYFNRKGAFISKPNILPILIKFPDNSIIYDFHNETILENFIKLFLPENYTINIKVGDMINANYDESIEQYRDRVYEIMNQQYKEM